MSAQRGTGARPRAAPQGRHRRRASTPSGATAGNVRDEGLLVAAINECQRHGGRGVAGSASPCCSGATSSTGTAPCTRSRSAWPRPGTRTSPGGAPRWPPPRPSHDGVAWTFAPMIDISEEPRWGRVAESLGESPVLAGRLAVAMVQRVPGRRARQGSIARLRQALRGLRHGPGRPGLRHRDRRREHPAQPAPAAVPHRRGRRGVLGHGGVQRRRRHPHARAPPPAARRAQGRVGRSTASSSPTGTASASWSSRASPRTCGTPRARPCAAGVDLDMCLRLLRRTTCPTWSASGDVPLEMVDDAVRRVLRMKFRSGVMDRPYTAEGHSVVEPSRAARTLAREPPRCRPWCCSRTTASCRSTRTSAGSTWPGRSPRRATRCSARGSSTARAPTSSPRPPPSVTGSRPRTSSCRTAGSATSAS